MFLVLALAFCAPVQRYSGHLLGVTATASFENRVAQIELDGVPLGGRLSGAAWFDNEGELVVDSVLSRALRRRLVRLHTVREHEGRVEVTLSVPVFGTRTVSLHRLL